MTISQIPKPSNAYIDSPDHTPPPLNLRVATALERALPGVDANTLIHTLDTLTGGRHSYTLVGSASMHLHALEHPNATCSLPMPNDLDVVVNDSALRRVELASPETLGQLNLRRDRQFKHLLYLQRPNQPDLKIDVVPASTPGFKKFQANALSIHGVRIGRLADSLADYRTRLKDEEYIDQCGGQAQAHAKMQPWLKYFDQFDLEGKTLPRTPLPIADRGVARILKL